MIEIVKKDKNFVCFDPNMLCIKRSLIANNDYLSNIINQHSKKKNQLKKENEKNNVKQCKEGFNNNLKNNLILQRDEINDISEHMKECKIGMINGSKFTFKNKFELSDEFNEKIKVEQYYKKKNKELMNRMFT